MGAFGSGLAGGVNSINQLRQQQHHNQFMTGLMQQMLGRNTGTATPDAPTMEGPLQGPQMPQGGISLQNMMMSRLRGLPIAQMLGGL